MFYTAGEICLSFKAESLYVMVVMMVLLKWDCIQKPRHTSRKKIKPINQIKTSLACWKQCNDFSFSPVDIFQVKVQTDNDDDYDERV